MAKSQFRRPEDLGGMGESYFRLLAKDAGLVANASSDDKSGWDFEVEIPSPLVANYSSQSKPVYRVQVKATMGDTAVVSMTFSSLVSLIQFGGPAFLFLVRFGRDLVPTSAHLLHLDQATALEILKSLRKREVANPGIKLNKVKMTVKFAVATRLDALNGTELRRRLEEALKGTYLSYIESKIGWLRDIEIDSVRWRFNIRFRNEKDMQGMADCFLGYETPFEVSSVSYLAPMGIPDEGTEPPENFYATTIKPIEEDLPRTIVRLRTTEYGPKYEFKGVLYSVPSHLPRQFAAIRIQTALFDIILRLEPPEIKFRPADLEDDRLKAPLSEVFNLFEYLANTLIHKETYLEVSCNDGTPPLNLILGSSHVTIPEDFEEIHAALRATFLKLSTLGLSDSIMRPSNLFIQRTYYDFLRHVGHVYEPKLSFEFQTDGEPKANADVTIFNAPIKFEGKTVVFFAAFFGTVDFLENSRVLGTFDRSEYLGEMIVPAESDLKTIIKVHSEKLQHLLQKKGHVVL